jgi:hypothetical protein
MMKLTLTLSLCLTALAVSFAQTPLEIAGLKFTAPKAWIDAKPLSPMRIAQWTVPPLKGGGSGEMVAFYFGPGQGGDTTANVDRWLTTMTTPEGTPAKGSITVRKVAGYTVTQLLVFGTYSNAMATPGVPPKPMPNYGLIGAVIERSEGPVFFRLTGPEALVKAQLVNFTQFIETMKPSL